MPTEPTRCPVCEANVPADAVSCPNEVNHPSGAPVEKPVMSQVNGNTDKDAPAAEPETETTEETAPKKGKK
jgi:hypothetical protein